MSIQVMTDVWKHSPLSGAPLLLMLSLADYSNGERVCWPSVASLARNTRLSERQARRLMVLMAKQGHIIVHERAGRNGTNLYEIPDAEVMAGLRDLDTSELRRVRDDTPDICDTPVTCDTPDTHDSTPPVTDDTPPLSRVTPNPSVTVNRTSMGAGAPMPPPADSSSPASPLDMVEKKNERKAMAAGKERQMPPSRTSHEFAATPAQVRELVAYFCHKSGKEPPDLSIRGSHGKMKALWEYKVDDYFRLMGKDMGRTKDAIDFAVSRLSPDNIVSPKSLENVIMANRERIPKTQTATVIDGRAVSMPG